MAEHGAHSAVGVGDRGGELHRCARVEGLAAHHDQLLIQRLAKAVVLARAAVQVLVHERRLGLVQHRRQVQFVGLPVLGGLRGVQRADLADHLVDGPEAQLGHHLPDFLGDEYEEVLDELRFAGEPLPQHRVLGGHTDRTGVQVAHPHHDAARHHQRRRREAEFLGAEQRGDHHVAARLELAVDLNDDPVA